MEVEFLRPSGPGRVCTGKGAEMTTMSKTPSKTPDEIRSDVREHYGAIARGRATACCGGGAGGSERLGYSAAELGAAPPGADLGLGCGNPQAIAQLGAGEVVVDLGAGGGFDCFLAARAVGPTGRVIGVDMSADMVALARANAAKQAIANVELRLGEIEHLPVADATADVVMSNCVINLSPDKPAVYREAFRVLRPGGRLAISDVVALRAMPTELAGDVAALCACVGGAAPVDELAQLLRAVGFTDVRITLEPASREVIASWGPGRGFEDHVASARITAVRPPDGDPARDEPAGGACCAPGCCA
jgi:SAM-dependent methyltransferase